MTENHERVTINGTTYIVEAIAQNGDLAHANDPDCRRMLLVRRPNGRKMSIAKDYGPKGITIIC